MFFFHDKKKIPVVAPIDGTIVDITKVPDKVFADRLIGDGVAIDPSGTEFGAPIAGQLITVYPTGHAYGISTKKGVQLILHVGINTVEANGAGFTIKVKENQRVKAGETLVNVDWDKAITKKTMHKITPIIFINNDKIKNYTIKILQKAGTKVNRGDLIAELVPK